MKRRCIIIVGIRLSVNEVNNESERTRNFKACLKALNDQTIKRDFYEIWVCEEGRKPNAEALTSGLCDQYVFRYSEKAFNRGRCFNEGARASQARPKDLLCLLDADLLVDWRWVERMYYYIGDQQRAILPYTNVLYLDNPSSNMAIQQRGYRNLTPYLYRHHRNSFESVGGSLWIHAQLYWHIGGHDEAFVGWGCEDTDLWFRLEKIIRPIRLENVTLLHLFHPRAAKGPEYENNRKRYEEKHKDRLLMRKSIFTYVTSEKTIPLDKGTEDENSMAHDRPEPESSPTIHPASE